MNSPCPVRCGPAGWSYPHWDGVVYPRPRPRGFHPLEYLAGYFDLVEINTSFYQDLRPEISRLWLSRVQANPRFVFTAKLHRRFTHERSLDSSEAAAFIRGLAPLAEAGRLGCLLMQFPWSFRFTEENRDFLIRLRRLFSRFPLVAEMRHSSWMREEALGMLIDYHIGFCNLDQPARSSAMPPTAVLTTGIAYVRLHGRGEGDWLLRFDAPGTTGPGPGYLYSVEELTEWRQRIERLRSFAEAVFVATANDAGGRAVLNAWQLQVMLDRQAKPAPAGLRRRFGKELEALGGAPEAPPPLFGALSQVA
jgi:uncharacterized protein YecE (DUF72 family)